MKNQEWRGLNDWDRQRFVDGLVEEKYLSNDYLVLRLSSDILLMLIPDENLGLIARDGVARLDFRENPGQLWNRQRFILPDLETSEDQ